MAIIGNTTGYSDLYDGQRYYAEQERRYREQMERERERMYRSMQQQSAYNINTDTYGGVTAQQMQETKPAKKVGKVEPDYLSNQKLLLLGEAS